MQQEAATQQVSPFFELLSDAEEIQVREISPRKFTGSDILKTLVKASNGLQNESQRAFVVLVRNPPSAAKKEESGESLKGLPRDYLIKNADVLLGSKDYLLARNVYSFLLKQNIRDLDALKGLGICLFRLGETVAAKKCFRAYRDLSQHEEGFFWLGMAEAANGHDELAATYFTNIQDADQIRIGLRFEYFKEAGNVFTRLDQLEKAEYFYKKAIELEPTSDTVYVNLGTLSLRAKRFEAAHTHFVKALSMNNRNARAHSGLGLASLELGQTAFAQRQFEKALDCDSQNLVALTNLVRLGKGDSQLKQLREKVDGFLARDRKSADARYLHAVCEFKLGQYQSCQREVDSIIKDCPNHDSALRLREELSHYFKSAGGNV